MIFFITAAGVMALLIVIIHKLAGHFGCELPLSSLIICGICAIIINFLIISVTPFLTNTYYYTAGLMILFAAFGTTCYNKYSLGRKIRLADGSSLSPAELKEQPAHGGETDEAEEASATSKSIETSKISEAIETSEINEAAASIADTDTNTDADTDMDAAATADTDITSDSSTAISASAANTAAAINTDVTTHTDVTATADVAANINAEADMAASAKTAIVADISNINVNVNINKSKTETENTDVQAEAKAETGADIAVPAPLPNMPQPSVTAATPTEAAAVTEAAKSADTEQTSDVKKAADTADTAHKAKAVPAANKNRRKARAATAANKARRAKATGKAIGTTAARAAGKITAKAADKTAAPVSASHKTKAAADTLQKDRNRQTAAAIHIPTEVISAMTTMDQLLDFAFEQNMQKKPQVALTAYEMALTRYRDDSYAPFIVVSIANIHKEQGNYGAAISSIQSAMDLPALQENESIKKQFKDTISYLEVTEDVLQKAGLGDISFKNIPKERMSQIESIYNSRKSR